MHQARARLDLMRGTLSAIGLAFSKEHAPLPKSVREDLKAARLEEG